MATHSRLLPGEYQVEENNVCVTLMHNNKEHAYSVYKNGEVFTVPNHVNNFWSALTWYPGLGETCPQIKQLKKV